MISPTLDAEDIFGDSSLYEHHYALEIFDVVDLSFGINRDVTQTFYDTVAVNYANDPLTNDQFDFFQWES